MNNTIDTIRFYINPLMMDYPVIKDDEKVYDNSLLKSSTEPNNSK